jgi:cysteine desulfurase
MGDEKRPIYLDHNATTPVDPRAVEAMEPYLREHFGNPSSRHSFGERAREGVERAREQVAALIGADPGEIIFVSGGTEANNLAIRGTAGLYREPGHLVTSTIEHSAVAEPCTRLENKGWQVDRIGVGQDGRVNLDAIQEAVDEETTLVSVMHGNNETGVVQPIEEIGEYARECGAVFHTDAAQTTGKFPLDVNALGVDFLSIAGHKMYAPKGIGVLYMREGTSLKPLLSGAGHESGCRPGTEPVPAIVAMGEACRIAADSVDEESARLTRLRNYLHQRLNDEIEVLEANGSKEYRLPNTLNVRFPEVSGRRLLSNTPEVAASTGSACHEAAGSASAVLQQLGLTRSEALSAVRLSLGRHTTEEEVDRAASLLADSFRQLRQ